MPASHRAAVGLSLVATATFALLSACGDSPPPPQDEGASSAAAREGTSRETVFDDMLQTKDRAQAVEGLTLGRKAEIDAALEAQQGEGR